MTYGYDKRAWDQTVLVSTHSYQHQDHEWIVLILSPHLFKLSCSLSFFSLFHSLSKPPTPTHYSTHWTVRWWKGILFPFKRKWKLRQDIKPVSQRLPTQAKGSQLSSPLRESVQQNFQSYWSGAMYHMWPPPSYTLAAQVFLLFFTLFISLPSGLVRLNCLWNRHLLPPFPLHFCLSEKARKWTLFVPLINSRSWSLAGSTVIATQQWGED